MSSWPSARLAKPPTATGCPISFGDILVAQGGRSAPSLSEELGADYMKGREIAITVDVGVGEASATVWTCDLTADYIAINADYRS